MVALVPIDQRGFEEFLEKEIHDYAQEKIISGNWLAEEALVKSRAEFLVYYRMVYTPKINLCILLWMKTRTSISVSCGYRLKWKSPPESIHM